MKQSRSRTNETEAGRVPGAHGGLELPLIDVTLPGAASGPDIYESALDDLEKRGFSLVLRAPAEPLPDIPDDPLSLGNALFEVFAKTEKWWEFVSSTYTDLECRQDSIKRHLAKVVARLRKKGIKGHDIELDDEYEKWQDALVKLGLQMRRVKQVMKELQQRMRMLSRNVEGLKTEVFLGGRADNLGRRGTPGGYGSGY